MSTQSPNVKALKWLKQLKMSQIRPDIRTQSALLSPFESDPFFESHVASMLRLIKDFPTRGPLTPCFVFRNVTTANARDTDLVDM